MRFSGDEKFFEILQGFFEILEGFFRDFSQILHRGLFSNLTKRDSPETIRDSL